MTHPLRYLPLSPILRGYRPLSVILDDAERFLTDLTQQAAETETAYIYTIELPGFKRDQVIVEVLEIADGIHLSIRAAKNGAASVWTQSNGGVVDSANCRSHTITLPSDADSTKVEAKLEDGLLVITVQKLAKPTPPAPRKVTVS